MYLYASQVEQTCACLVYLVFAFARIGEKSQGNNIWSGWGGEKEGGS